MSPEAEDATNRGTKRKHPGEEVKRLTPTQRLAAARKAEAAAALADAENQPEADEDVGQPEAELSGRDDAYYKGLYQSELDFQVLAEEDADFAECLKDGRHLVFTDPKSVMQLTKTLLKRDFDVQIELPPDRLCPPVPNRHNYILWLKTLLDSTSSSYADAYEPDRKVTGLDIGTGASAIYSLLGCTQRPWSFIATDIDAKSLEFARKNVELNDLQSRIQIVERTVTGELIPLDELEIDQLDFVMTNPPFYTSESELLELAKKKSQPPSSACTGSPNEMVCDGGEIGFLKRILAESLVLKARVQWYTSMLGKQSSVEVAVSLLKEHGIENYALAEFVQGNKTRRWAIGWSFVNRRPSIEACRGFEPPAGKKLLPPLTEFTAATRTVRRAAAEQLRNIFWTQLEDVTEGLDLASWNLDEDRLRVVGFADANVWGRAYRRDKERRARAVKEVGPAQATKPQRAKRSVAECAFGFSIAVHSEPGQRDGEECVAVVVRWLQGSDFAMFESFYGMLRNAFQNVVS